MSNEDGGAISLGAPGERQGVFLLTHLERDGEKIRVKLEERIGSQLWVRPLDDEEPEPDEPIRVETDDVVIPFTLVHSVGVNTSPIAGDTTGFMTSIPVVEIRRDVMRQEIWLRSLKPGEPDPPERVRVPWGYTVTVDPGSIVLDIDRIDGMTPTGADGYAPLANTIWTWMNLQQTPGVDALARFLLAAARRLDVAHRCFDSVRADMDRLNAESAGPNIRAVVFEIVGQVEIMVIALSRAVDMAVKLNSVVPITTTVPLSVFAAKSTLTIIRDAYEHIEDRALGRVRNTAHKHALTIFDWTSLLREDAITYGDQRLELRDVPGLLIDTRRYLKEGGAEAEFILASA
jgi:hypothetical protein